MILLDFVQVKYSECQVLWIYQCLCRITILSNCEVIVSHLYNIDALWRSYIAESVQEFEHWMHKTGQPPATWSYIFMLYRAICACLVKRLHVYIQVYIVVTIHKFTVRLF